MSPMHWSLQPPSPTPRPPTTFTGVLLGFAPVQGPLAVLEAAASVGIVRLLATRRPDLIPSGLHALAKVPSSIAVVLVCGVLGSGLSGCGYEGIDGTVFGSTAEAAGRTPTDSLLDLSQGELGLAMTIVILFGLGFVAGRLGADPRSRARCTSTLSMHSSLGSAAPSAHPGEPGPRVHALLLNVGADSRPCLVTASVGGLLLVAAGLRATTD